MLFTLMVTGPAYGTQQSSSAFQFAQAVILSKQRLFSVFFYQDGVYNANNHTYPASDEINLVHAWQELSMKYNVTLNVCISSAMRRGVINDNIVKYHDNNHKLEPFMKNNQNVWSFRGLGALAEAISICDRIVQF